MAEESDRTRGVKAVLQKLEESNKAGDFYQSQQLYKTLYTRYEAKKRFLALEEMLVSGARFMLQNNQSKNATELSSLLIKHYEIQKVLPSKESLGNILSIFKAFPAGIDKCKKQFITATINWTALVLGNKYGSPELHDAYATEFHINKVYNLAEKHYLLGTNPSAYADLLLEWSKFGNNSERDLFVARAVFRYLILNNAAATESAAVVLKKYTAQSNLETPLIHFVTFLIKTVEMKASQLFVPLKQKYAAQIQRDAYFSKYLDVIGKETFGIEPPPQAGGMGGLLGNLMQGLMS